jgi:ParB family chromosome partitioning protein
MTLEDVPLTHIDPCDLTFQYRFPSGVSGLRISLESEGQRQPVDLIGCRPPYRVVDGFRRILAATALEWTSVKALVHRSLSEEEAYRMAFTKNVVRRNLSPLERAQAMAVGMQERGLKERDLSHAFGISERQVGRYLKLLSFPDPIKRIVDGATVTMAHARVLASYGVTHDAYDWRTRIRAEKLSAREIAAILARTKGGPRSRGRPRVYMRREGDAVRMYAFTISRTAPKADREAVVRLLQSAIDFLKA